MTELESIPPDGYSRVICHCQPLPTQAFRTSTIFVWYDYFSCPQLGSKASGHLGEEDDLSKAVGSIPSYVLRCEYFFALCPVVESEGPEGLRAFSSCTWDQRGWCRMELIMRKLSPDHTWIMISDGRMVEAIATVAGAEGGPPGEGDFTVERDKEILGPVLLGAIERKLDLLLANGDLVGYRVLLNMQSVHMRNLHASLLEPVPGFQLLPGQDDASAAAARFMHQNGFQEVHEADAGGWFPLHYAALGGDPLVIRGLLSCRADIDCQTSQEQALCGAAPGNTSLTICVLMKHNEAARLLISANAALHPGLTPSLQCAAFANNREGIQMLLQAGFDPATRDIFGFSALAVGALYGSQAAVEELWAQKALRPWELVEWELSESLITCAVFRGGSAEFVQRLVELRANVNHQRTRSLLPASNFEISEGLGALQYRLGREGVWEAYCYHCNGMTPLMSAVLCGQHESAAALIAAGARLDLVNSRNWTAADFGRERSPPDFLHEAFAGCTEGCERVAAVARGYSVMKI